MAGATGPAGPAGQPGAAGPAGPSGPIGIPGLVGATGPQGLQGLAGSTGAAGSTGPTGATGAVGAPGGIGAAGAAGTPGASGAVGAAGPKGDAGAAGAQGPAGPTGPTGAAGATGTGLSAYAYVYNLTPETIAVEADVPFDSNGVITPGFTHAPGAAEIGIVSAGTYQVTFGSSGTEPSQFALFLNGAPVPGATYGSGAGTQQNNGQVIVMAGAGDVLTVKNHSSAAAVGLASDIGGTQQNTNASVLIERLN